MQRMRSVRLSLGLVVLAAASCRYPSLPDFAAPQDGSDGAINDAAPVPLELELLAGDIGGPGNLDGTGAAAHFLGPSSVTVDSAGNLYVADSYNNTIRKVTAAGIVTTLAGTAGVSGTTDGTGAAARFNHPQGVAVDGVSNVYVADTENSTIRKVTAAGVVTTLAGTAGMYGSTDDTGAAARFNYPQGVAVDGFGNVYVADSGNSTIRKITADGVVTTLAGAAGMGGSTDGTGAAARFFGPAGVAVDGAGSVYVADSGNNVIRKVTTAGGVTTLAGTAGMWGSSDGTGAAARFYFPSGVAADRAGNVYVADTQNNTIRKVTAAGVVTTLAGTASRVGGYTDGMDIAARFNSPSGVAVDSAGKVYVADSQNDTIRKITTAGAVTTLAGASFESTSGSTDGTGAVARFRIPRGVAVDSASNIFVADGNATIRKVTATGVVTTLAGTAGMYGSADGTGAEARFFSPSGMAVDSTGNIYVADGMYNTIRKITPVGAVTTLAGAASTLGGSLDGIGAEARFRNPHGVAVDSAGNIYVADSSNSTIRKITPDGVVTTLAGIAGMPGSTDGTGAEARFAYPEGLAVDSAGNVYVADSDNSTIRKVTAAGVVTTLAGTAGMSGSTDGMGAVAHFFSPSGMAVDSAGNVYVVDNSTIRKVTAAGGTTTIAGMSGMIGIVLGTTPRFAYPRSLAITGDSIVISDTNAILLLRHGAR